MKRIKLLLAMAAMMAVLALVVCYASPYAPVVQEAPENIEEIWAIEDARTERTEPLITALENNDVPLVYDAQNNVFYCTLGMDNQEEWPDIHLTAPEAGQISLMFVDDYTYDWCQDAIREGYAYQILAYSDTEFFYTEIVFTGLTQVQIAATQEITTEDSPIEVTVSSYGCEPVKSYGRIHLRGASTLNHEKKSYRVEFTREPDGRRKVSKDVPGFGIMNAINLNPMVHDELLVREKLCWDMYENFRGQDEPFGARKTQYAEVYLNGVYQGVYLMVEPMDCAQELGGKRAATDSVYRTAVLSFSRDREYVEHPYRANTGYELYHHSSAGTGDAFTHLQPWIDLNKTKDDALFEQKALACIDLQSMIEFDLFVQMCGMTDNVFNNMYIIAHPSGEKITYTFAPWDMDMTWGRKKEEAGEYFENWLYFPIADRLIEMDAGGVTRDLVVDTWKRMRETVFNAPVIAEKLDEYTRLLGDSGAWARNTARWGGFNYYPDLYELVVYTDLRLEVMDRAIETIADKSRKTIPFLSNTQYEGKGTPIAVE